MGDGGVACVPVQHIMERFSVCGTKTNKTSNSTFSSTTVKKKMNGGKMNGGKMKAKKGRGVNLSSSKSSGGGKEIECNGDVGKDEVEEGELGTLPVENGELVPEKRKYEIKSEIEKGEMITTSDVIKRGSEFVKGRWRKGEWGEKGDYICDKFNRKGELDKNDPGYEPGEFVPDRWRKGEGSAREDFNYSRTRRHDFGKDKGWKGDHEWTTPPSAKDKGWRNDREWTPPSAKDGWRNNREWTPPSAKDKGWRNDREWTPPSAKDKGWRNDREWSPPSAKDKGWKNDREWSPPSAKDKGWKNDREWTPPSAKDKGWRNDYEWTPPSSVKHSGEKDAGRSGIQHVKRLPRYEPSIPERNPRISSKIVGEEGSSKSELRNGNNPAREYFSGNRLKRHGTDSDKSDRKYRGEYDDFSSSKSRKLSDDGSRAVYTAEHGLQRSTEKLHKNAPSNRNIPSDRYSSRHCETSKVSFDRLNSSPRHSERSPRDRVHHLDNWDRSPARREKSPYDRGRHFDHSRSPYDRSRHYDHRSRSPSYSEWSPQDQGRHHHRRDRTPNFVERSPRDRGRTAYHRDTGRKSGPSDKRESHFEGKKHEGKCSSQKDVSGKDQITKDSEVRSCPENSNCSIVKSGNHPVNNEGLPQCPAVNALEPPEENGAVEEMASMEEDMDICNTPPHVSTVPKGNIGKWYYLDQFGVEQGPSRLCKLKSLVEEGYIVADHFVKHADSGRWVTVENAVSPMASVNFPSVVSDVVTQMVSPPEAPGNVLEDNCDLAQLNDQVGEDTPLSQIVPCHADSLAASEPSDEHHIDERVGTLLEGFSVIPGRELEIIGEVLQMNFEHVEWEKCGSAEGEQCGQSSDECLLSSEAQKESTEPRTSDKENDFCCSDPAELFSGLWSCKGGDWKRNDEATQDRLWKKKLVLNDGYPLCLMSKSGIEDPRWLQKDELYYPSHSRRLDLPSWAFISPDEWNDSNIVGRPNQPKPPVLRGTKGMMLPVIRINACVVKEHGSFVSETRTKVRGKDRHPQRSSRLYVATGDSKRSSEEGVYHSKSRQDQESHGSHKSSIPLSIPNDRLCSADELQLHFGEWYYLDGAGHERGPFSFIELQVLVDHGVIPENSSAFRKVDRLWVPVASSSKTSNPSKMSQTPSETLGASVSELESSLQSAPSGVLCTFHGMHPQFIGYTQGKLHELVMKSYKSRELAAAINEVLDPWINARQPKKESNPDFRVSKKARCHGSEEEYEMEEDISVFQNDECQFDDLCGDETFNRETITKPGIENGSWGLLDDRVLARIFHFLKADVKSLVYAALTCKHWRFIVKIYNGISRQVDLLSVASSCSDSMMQKIMNGYNKEKITSLVLRDCTGITSRMLEDVLLSFSCLSCIDIRGCSQLEDVAVKFPNINWIRSRSSNLKVKSLKNISDRTSSSYRTYNCQENQMDDSIGLRDYLESSDKREFANQLFRRSLYKRAKVFDARKSSSMLSRDAQLRHLAMRKSRNCFKRMKEFLASSLREIMKENTFEFFVPKVGEIEEKIRSGYYANRGLNSAKEDISRMCRDALKSKNRGDAKDMNRIIASFIRLATRLEEDPESFCTRDEMIKTWKDESPPGFSSSTTKYKKNPARMSEKKYFNRSNGSSYVNGGSDYGEFASDREIKRRLSKLRLKSLDSGSETSDDLGRSSGDTSSDSDSTASETESDLDLRSECGTAESKDYFTADDGFDSLADDREWGARMTKASLVPPVTRKYEVIDHYVIVADEKEVKRKMLVSLPEDYAEKLSAQRNGIEESDMEIPEVKDYKPRKTLGEEVLEQEVYGIDPYTHNLLLDSMPDEPDWSLLDKHVFIEDVLLSTLNKQVRRFTGSHTPMIYSLKPVFEEILENADKDQDKRTVRLCQFILKAIDTRPEDNYVAYRKGLGVVCNKEGGFSQDDFVVEFLGEVYPAWKWFEKQDGIRSLQRNNNDPAPEFYNIYLERPKGDADGYDLVVVDAMHKANYASRICHSCRPNCEAKVTAVDGQYQIGIYSVRPIAYGEEITFDYNSVTESKEEYEASVCLCGSQVCRGSYLNLTGEGAFLKVLQEYHGLLDRHQLMLEACELNSVSEEDYIDLGKAGLGSCLLAGLPQWLIAYSARLVRFINFERTKLPDEILKHNLEEKKKYFSDICLEVEKNESEIQAEGVYNQRLQNLALTLDKVRYVMRCVFGDPEKAPPPIERLSPEDAVSFIWRGEGSLVEELLQCMAPHLEDSIVSDLKAKIRAHDPSRSDDLETGIRKSLIWLRDEVRDLPCTYKSRHDAAADLIHLYAYTKCFFRIREYKTVTSPPVYISPLDLGPRYTDKLGPGIHEYRKKYGENYCLGQLIYWYNQANADPENCLFRASRGCLSLPEAGSFYAKVQKPSRQRVYGPRTVKFMLSRMEKQPQRAWPKDRIWSFKSSPKVFASPILDGILNKAPLEKEMVHWLKHRPAIFQAKWDR